MDSIIIRKLQISDSISDLTKLLNTAYKPLLDIGLDFVAASQNEQVTKSRISKAHACYLALLNDELIGTILLYHSNPSQASKWYDQSYVAKIGQFAVLPKYQSLGIGSKLLDHVEKEVRKFEDISELALDTAENASHLISYYKKRAYRPVETVKWRRANYKSVILSKKIKD